MESAYNTEDKNIQDFKRRDIRFNTQESQKLMYKKLIRESITNIIDISETLINEIRKISEITIKRLKTLEKASDTNFKKQELYDKYEKEINSKVIKKFKLLIFQKSHNLSSLTQESLNKKLEKLKNIHESSSLLKEQQIVYSSLAITTLSQLNQIQLDPIDSYQNCIIANFIMFKVFFQFLGKSLPSDIEEAWTAIKELLTRLKSSSCSRETINEKMMKEVKNFDFSNQNIDEIELILNGQNILLDETDEFSYILLPFYYILREACIFSGALEGKGPACRQFSRLDYKLKLFDALNN